MQVFSSLQVFLFNFFNIRALASLTDKSLQPQIKDFANKRNESLSPSFMQTGTCINYYNYVPNYFSQLDLRPCAARHHVTNWKPLHQKNVFTEYSSWFVFACCPTCQIVSLSVCLSACLLNVPSLWRNVTVKTTDVLVAEYAFMLSFVRCLCLLCPFVSMSHSYLSVTKTFTCRLMTYIALKHYLHIQCHR